MVNERVPADDGGTRRTSNSGCIAICCKDVIHFGFYFLCFAVYRFSVFNVNKYFYRDGERDEDDSEKTRT